jgi:hypothetical protein
VKLRRGTFSTGLKNPIIPDWKLNLIGVKLMMWALWRSTGHKFPLPAPASQELKELIGRCRVGLSLKTIERLVSFGRHPWLHRKFSYEGLERMLLVNIEEKIQLDRLRPQKKHVSREQRMIRRQAEILWVIHSLKRDEEAPSIRNIQKRLLIKRKLDLSYGTIQRALERLPRR